MSEDETAGAPSPSPRASSAVGAGCSCRLSCWLSCWSCSRPRSARSASRSPARSAAGPSRRSSRRRPSRSPRWSSARSPPSSARTRTPPDPARSAARALYVVRGCLDANDAPDRTQWLTPFGRFERTGPAVENDPLPLLAALGLTAALLVAALAAAEHRDLSGGIVPPRPVPPTRRTGPSWP